MIERKFSTYAHTHTYLKHIVTATTFDEESLFLAVRYALDRFSTSHLATDLWIAT